MTECAASARKACEAQRKRQKSQFLMKIPLKTNGCITGAFCGVQLFEKGVRCITGETAKTGEAANG